MWTMYLEDSDWSEFSVVQYLGWTIPMHIHAGCNAFSHTKHTAADFVSKFYMYESSITTLRRRMIIDSTVRHSLLRRLLRLIRVIKHLR